MRIVTALAALPQAMMLKRPKVRSLPATGRNHFRPANTDQRNLTVSPDCCLRDRELKPPRKSARSTRLRQEEIDQGDERTGIFSLDVIEEVDCTRNDDLFVLPHGFSEEDNATAIAEALFSCGGEDDATGRHALRMQAWPPQDPVPATMIYNYSNS